MKFLVPKLGPRSTFLGGYPTSSFVSRYTLQGFVRKLQNALELLPGTFEDLEDLLILELPGKENLDQFGVAVIMVGDRID